MRNTILMIIMMVLGTAKASAQFYTITKETDVKPVLVTKTAVNADNIRRNGIPFGKGKSERHADYFGRKIQPQYFHCPK